MTFADILPWINTGMIIILALVGWIYGLGRLGQKVKDHSEECERRHARLDNRLLDVERSLRK